MRYKRNPSDWQMYDRETASLRERLRAAQEALNGYGVDTKGDPRFQGIRPDAGWANKDLRPVVDSVEQDVKFYADFFQKRNPRKRSKMSYRKKNPRRRNGEGWYSAAQNYLAQLGAAEYEAQAKQWVKSGRSMSTFRYSPTSYHRDLVEFLGKGDEEGFKARKNLEGYSTALKV